MAFRKTIAKRPLGCYLITSSPVTVENSPISIHAILRRDYVASSESGDRGFLRRFFHRKASGTSFPGFPEIFSVPVGEKLRDKLRGINVTGGRLRLDGLTPLPSPPTDAEAGGSLAKISVEDARKLLRVSQIEKLKAKLREIPKSWISYYEFGQVCLEGCGNEAQALELAKMLDQSGNVIVLGNVVFLRPEQSAAAAADLWDLSLWAAESQLREAINEPTFSILHVRVDFQVHFLNQISEDRDVVKSMETMISESIALPNDPRRKELDELESRKAEIDKKAESLVRGELYCGLGFLVVQTLGFMRLTFWELSWDVMEPICFFVTSLHFAAAYCFFLRTSTEPSFQGYFQQRFKAKQKKLMKLHSFDIEKYNQLRQAFYPNYSNGLPNPYSTLKHEDDALL